MEKFKQLKDVDMRNYLSSCCQFDWQTMNWIVLVLEMKNLLRLNNKFAWLTFITWNKMKTIAINVMHS